MSKQMQTARTTARAAGKVLLKHFHTDVAVSFKHHHEAVSTADLESNDLITKRLGKAFPKHAILSEESPNYADGIGPEPTWVIDPLDGTTNFIAGIPLFAVAISLLKDRKPVLGVVYDPVHGELFEAERGKGFRLNGKKRVLDKGGSIRSGMILAGRGHKGDDRGRHGKIIYHFERKMPYFRRLGSAAIMLAFVAAGRANGVILTGNKPWDTTAGALMVEEAGGKVTDYCGKAWSIDSLDLVATRGTGHKSITDVTKTLDKACRK